MSVRRPVVLLVTGALIGAGAAISSAGPAAPAEPLARVVVASSTITADRDRFDGTIHLGTLGTYLRGTAGPLEFRTGRARYDAPVTTDLTTGSAADRRTVTLPAGLTRSPGRLTGVTQVTVRDSRGRQVLRRTLDFCPGRGSVRHDKGAPATSPYATECGRHPFTIGAALGIQDGWASPLVDSTMDDYEGLTFAAPPGNYTAELVITPRYRSALGLSTQQATATVLVKARNSEDYYGAGRRATGGHDHAHGMENGKPIVPTTLRAASRRPTPRAGDAARAAGSGVAPNLRSLPAYEIRLERSGRRTYVDFGATVWNSGTSPLVVDGFRRSGTRLMDAYQYFFDAAGKQTGSAPAGTLQWDPRAGHHHWHFTAFASYRLLDADRTEAVRSGKEAFCLAPTDPVDTRLDGSNLTPVATTLAGACGDEDALGIREGLDIGWGDTYTQDLPGQSFDVTSLPNGTYYIRVIANPDGKLTETDRTDNGSLRRIRLGGTPGGRRTLKVTPYQGVKD
jgi:hypothetical protein